MVGFLLHDGHHRDDRRLQQEIPLSRGGEIFTTFLLFAGLGALLFVATEISRWVVEGELHQLLGRVRRSRMIDQMSGHRILHAGADRVVNPYQLGGARLAHLAIEHQGGAQ